MRFREVAKDAEMTTKFPPSPDADLVLDEAAIERALRRIAHEIVEANPDLSQLSLIGVPSRGVEVARRIAEHIGKIDGTAVDLGVIDVSMHRDDIGQRGRLSPVEVSELPLNLQDRTLIIVDDVCFTGRTCRSAMDAIASFGRPARIQYAVLIDRGHRELPIRPDYVGRNIPTARGQRVYVRFRRTDEVPDSVWVEKR